MSPIKKKVMGKKIKLWITEKQKNVSSRIKRTGIKVAKYFS